MKLGKGTVSLDAQRNGPDGRWTGVVAGDLEILDGQESVGIRPASGEARWLVKVSGEKSVTYVPGCKVSLITTVNEGEDLDLVTGPDVYRVP